MIPSVNLRTNILRNKLYKQYVIDSPYAKHNKERIDWVLKNVYKKLIKIFNRNEDKVVKRLAAHSLWCETQTPIPILSEGGRLEHLYFADITVGNTIIEVDGPQHEKNKEYDEERDRQTSSIGYTTIRIPTSDLSPEGIDNYLQQLYGTN